MQDHLTTTDFTMQAEQLYDNGYDIVPINKGKKAPIAKGWQNGGFKPENIKAGVGVLCGQDDNPIIAIDIDFTNHSTAEVMSEWCHDNLGMTVERVGNAPKTLLVYRASEPMTKRVGRWFVDSKGTKQRVEVLGKGQQFVAYHIHPDTQKPYEWVDMLGGLAETDFDSLPVVTPEAIDTMLKALDQIAIDHGLKPESKAAPRKKPVNSDLGEDDLDLLNMPQGVELDEAKDLMVNLDATDYERWLAVGMALHHEYRGSDDAFEAWLDWSKTADNFDSEQDLQSRWKGFGNRAHGTTILTLCKWGNEANKKVKRANKLDVITESISQINNADDVLDLEAILNRIGRSVEAKEVITVSQLKAAAKDKYKELTGQRLSDSAVTQLLGHARDTSAENLERQTQYTEFGNAQKMIDMYGSDIMFAADTATWYRWNKNHWRYSTAPEIEQLAKDTLMRLLVEGSEQGMMGADQFDFLRMSLTNRMMVAMMKIIRTEKTILVETNQLDANKSILACGNGAVDLETGKLLHADRLARATIATGTNFNPKAKCPIFEQTVLDAFYDDHEMLAFFKRLMGYTLLADPKEDIIVIPYGTGSNGKSTIFGAIRDALGGHAVTADNQTFMGNSGSNAGAPRDDILRLRGRRFVYVTEPDEGKELREGLIKAMTGGEEMTARTAYSSTYVQFTPTWTVILPTNHKPIIKGDDFGIWRRILLVPFTRNFSTDDTIVKDNDRSDKLALEHEGILAWLVQGALDYQAEGLNPPKLIEDAREEYKRDMDLLAEWIDECCVLGNEEAASNQELWASWRQFADARGELRFISNARTLNKKLEARTAIKRIQSTHGIRGRGLLGIGVVSDFDDLDSE